jgi:type I protein arginine methyltransferase
MYSLAHFGSMISDEIRMQAYLKAMKKAIRPGSIVLDIGTGTGIMAFFALKFGAKFVYAIEPNNLIHIAEEMAQANGFSSKVKFIKDFSTNVTLDEKVDVVVSDLRSALPFLEMHIPSIADARARFLKPAGVLIPLRDTLWVSVVESPGLYNKLVEPWEKYANQFDMDIARSMAVNDRIVGRAKASDMLTSPFNWVTLDYTTIQSPNVFGETSKKFLRSGTAHGLIIWYDAEFIKNVTFHNKPGTKNHPKVYGSVFFPLHHPVKVAKGDNVDIQIKATLVNDDYIWNWNTHFTDSKGREQAAFEQSTFYSQRLPLAALRRSSLAFVPSMNSDGEVDKFILDSINGSDTIEQIAQRSVSKFPEIFRNIQDASARVSKLAKRYGK